MLDNSTHPATVTTSRSIPMKTLAIALATACTAAELPATHIAGEWTALAGGYPGANGIVHHVEWAGDNLWAVGEFTQIGNTKLPGIGRRDANGKWSLPGADSWATPYQTYYNFNPRIVHVGTDGKVWTISDSGFVQEGPVVRSFDGTRWTSHPTGARAPSNFDWTFHGIATDRSGAPLVWGSFKFGATDTVKFRVIREEAGVWKDLGCPGNPGEPVLLGGDSLSFGAWILSNGNWSPSPLNSLPGAELLDELRLKDGTRIAYMGDVDPEPSRVGDLFRWDGISWKEFQPGHPALGFDKVRLGLDPSGAVLLSGLFRNRYLVLWESASGWDTLATMGVPYFDNTIFDLAVSPTGQIALGGRFLLVDTVPALNLAIRESGRWTAPGSGFAGVVNAITVGKDGSIVVGGYFSGVDGQKMSNLAQLHDGTWKPLGLGSNEAVFALATAPNGDIIAGGRFDSIGGIAASRVARWNGKDWHPMGAGFKNDVLTLAVARQGGVWASIDNGFGLVSRWNDTAWKDAFDYGNASRFISTISVSNDGAAFLGGIQSKNFRTWRASWTNVPEEWYGIRTTSNLTVQASTWLHDSVFALAGIFHDSKACPLAFTGGDTLASFGCEFTGSASEIQQSPSGSLFLSGSMQSTNANHKDNILRWDGSRMTAFDGLEGLPLALAIDSSRSLIAVGTLDHATGASVFRLANGDATGIRSRTTPAADRIFERNGRELAATRPGHLRIFDPTGKLVWNGDVQTGFVTSNLPLAPGMYLARLDGATERFLRSDR